MALVLLRITIRPDRAVAEEIKVPFHTVGQSLTQNQSFTFTIK